MSEMSRRIQRGVKVDNIKTIGPRANGSVFVQGMELCSAYDARATSRPEGEIDAEPTLRST